MIAVGASLAIQLEERGVTVLWGSTSRTGVHVERCEYLTRPDGVDPSSARALAAWVREAVGDERLPKRVVLVIPRADVIHKMLSLPAALASDPVALPGAVGLRMAKHVASASVGGVTDFTGGEVAVGLADDAEVSVLAATLPGPRHALLGEFARSLSHRGSVRMGLRLAGAGAVASARIVDADAPVLVISPGMVSTELLVVRGGHVVFARGVEFGLASEGIAPADFRDRLVIEAQRTVMSYRSGGDAGSIARVLLLGPRDALDEARAACAKAMGLDCQCLDHPAFVTFAGGMTPSARAAALPMAGVLAEGGPIEHAFDFASPRRAPDRAASKRQLALGGVLAAILLFGGFWAWASFAIKGKQAVISELTREQEELSKRVLAMRLEEERLNHLRTWIAPEIDWLAHLSWITRACALPPEMLVEQVSGNSDFAVEFLPKGRSIDGGTWRTEQAAKISLGGSAKDRDTANSLRARFIDSGLYTLDTPQPDTPGRFGFDLYTSVTRPVEQTMIERTRETTEAQE